MRKILGFFLAVVIFTGGIAVLAKNGEPVSGDMSNEPSALNYLLFGTVIVLILFLKN